MSLTYGSVCSGIEAVTVAWHPLGMRPLWFAEIEPFPSAVLAAHYPEVPNHGDFTRLLASPPAAPDVLVGGTPCQAFSVAGLRGGLSDPRGNLTLAYVALAGVLRPRWVVWENVPGVFSADGGDAFRCFVAGLVEVGYGVAWRVLDAQWFGVAQRRERVFVVGHLGADWRGPAAVLFEPEGVRRDSPPRRQAGARVAACLDAGAGGGGPDDNDARGGRLVASIEGGDVARSLNAHGNRSDLETETFVAHTLRAEGFDASEDGTGRGRPIVPFDTTQITSAANRSNPQPGDPCHPIPAHVHAPTIAMLDVYTGDGETADPVSASEAKTYSHEGSANFRLHNCVNQQRTGVRRLMPVELERLQGFPDGHTAILVGKRKKPAADGPRAKALGNSMAVPVMRWIGRRLLMVDALTGDGRMTPSPATWGV